MQSLYLLISSLLLNFAWLSPLHTYPWVTFSSEFASFIAVIVLLSIFLNKNLKIPKAQILMLPMITIPLLQLSSGLISDFSIALLSTLYLFGFWLMIVIGYNLSLLPDARERIIKGISWLLWSCAIVSSIMAIIQWLHLEHYINGVMQLKGNRPYANFGQPNNMATFLVMGLMATLYIYEKRKAALWLLSLSSFIFIFTIALSQSRTSWVMCLFIFVYWIYKQYRVQPRLSFVKLFAWSISFFIIAIWGLPLLTQFIETSTHTELIESTSIAERASSGYLRFEIWMQMLLAIKQQPWLGYGWNQTSIAQMAIFHLHPNHEWVISAHNVLLDILVWNGIPLGLLIIGYMTIWLFWLNKNAKDTTSIVAILMVSAILIHAMLEFPQRYAYFLLPMGFLLGLIQAQTPNLTGLTLHKNLIRCIWIVAFIILLVIWRDYKLFQHNSRLVMQGQPVTEKILGSTQILLLTQFQQRLDWLALKPTTLMSDQELAKLGKMVDNKATPYNLKKYAQLLVYNQKMDEAEKPLFILQQLYGQHISLAEIKELNRQI